MLTAAQHIPSLATPAATTLASCALPALTRLVPLAGRLASRGLHVAASSAGAPPAVPSADARPAAVPPRMWKALAPTRMTTRGLRTEGRFNTGSDDGSFKFNADSFKNMEFKPPPLRLSMPEPHTVHSSQ